MVNEGCCEGRLAGASGDQPPRRLMSQLGCAQRRASPKRKQTVSQVAPAVSSAKRMLGPSGIFVRPTQPVRRSGRREGENPPSAMGRRLSSPVNPTPDYRMASIPVISRPTIRVCMS
jgi:hypothetical protein